MRPYWVLSDIYKVYKVLHIITILLNREIFSQLSITVNYRAIKLIKHCKVVRLGKDIFMIPVRSQVWRNKLISVSVWLFDQQQEAFMRIILEVQPSDEDSRQ